MSETCLLQQEMPQPRFNSGYLLVLEASSNGASPGDNPSPKYYSEDPANPLITDTPHREQRHTMGPGIETLTQLAENHLKLSLSFLDNSQQNQVLLPQKK